MKRTKSWQKEHERLIAEMAQLVGAKSKTSSDINDALDKITDPAILLKYHKLNKQNDKAVEKAVKQL